MSKLVQKDRKYKITGMSYPLCPKCKCDLEHSKSSIFKAFQCPKCKRRFERRDLLRGWMINTFLKDEFTNKIWKLIISEIQLNHKQETENTTKRLEYAKKCRWYYDGSEYNWRCSNPEASIKDKDGLSNCYFGGQCSASCYETKEMEGIKIE